MQVDAVGRFASNSVENSVIDIAVALYGTVGLIGSHGSTAQGAMVVKARNQYRIVVRVTNLTMGLVR